MINENDSVSELFEDEHNFITNASNLSAYIFHLIENLNWVGFYFISGDELVLGPFQGKPACIRIKIGNGVCGSAVAQKKTLVVENVHEFPGHIACDADSNSELVVPLFVDGDVFGVLDLDSPLLNRFDDTLKEKIENYSKLLIAKSDVRKLIQFFAN